MAQSKRTRKTTKKTAKKGRDKARKAAAPMRQHQCLEARLDGKSYRQIGKELGISHVTAYKHVQRALATQREENAEVADDVLQLERGRLDDLTERVGRIVRNAADPDTKIKAINSALRVSESRRKLEGLDAPQRHDHTSGGEPLPPLAPLVVQVMGLTGEQLEKELQGFFEAGATVGIKSRQAAAAAGSNGSH